MPRSDEIPYPPGPDPDEVPDDLTTYPPSYVTQEWLLLVSLFLFLGIYLLLVLGSGFLTVYLAINVGGSWAFPKALGAAVSFLAFLFLVKGFFKRTQEEKELHLELTEKDHPDLFAFIRRVAEEAGADEPRKVIAAVDVNAGMIQNTSVLNLVVPPKKDLLVGLGLVNALNLSEFKAVLAHEFGHFTQGGAANTYTWQVQRIIYDLVAGRDWFDESIDWMRKQDGVVGLMGMVAYGCLWVPRVGLVQVFKFISFQRTNVGREREFHSDLVAASVCGSDAIVHGLLRTKFAAETLDFAAMELLKAADHKLYTADIYFHQHACAEILRKVKKDPHLGKPPTLADRWAGKNVQVFDEEKEEDPGDEGDYHPSNYDREENVKARYVPAPPDERSPWMLFGNPIQLRERMSYKWYRMRCEVPKGTELTDARAVQQFIDDEHSETTYDPKYDGVFDDRMIDPGDIDELNELIRKEPWPDDRLLLVYGKLFHDVKGRAEERKELVKEYNKVLNQAGGASRRARKLLKEIDGDIGKADEWFDSLDRRAYLVFVQMAYRVENDLYYQLVNRYRFHMAVQGIYKSARFHQEKAHFFFNMVAGQEQVGHDDFVELMHVLREARSALKKTLREAREMDMPAMKNFEEGDRLADFLLDQEIVRELPETFVKGKWVDKLLRQLDQVKSKAARLHFKSLGGILKLQEEIVTRFQTGRTFGGGDAPEIVEVVPERR